MLMIRSMAALAGLALEVSVLSAQTVKPVSAPLSNIRYEITFDSSTAAQRTLKVVMHFRVAGPGDVLLSLPSWTPGAYEVTNFARWVSQFSPKAGDKELTWDKRDYDTWRIRPAGAKEMEVSFDFLADSLDNAMAWSRDDFAFFNGTNVLLYAEGRSLTFPATVHVATQAGWQVVTGMHGNATAGYSEKNYHDLVDMPFFVGRFDLDSATVNGLNVRLASYPAGKLAGEQRDTYWAQYKKLFAPEIAVFGETPYDNYTTLVVFDDKFPGGSALEHQSSHLGIYTPAAIGQTWLISVTAHEMFHAFNVKRLRPADMVPYHYDVAQPTVWLWVSEGITDYYADLTLVRSGVVDSAGFFEATGGKISQVQQTTPVALEDASLSTWIHPTDGTGYLYYPKGSLAGFMLDIIIRDASNNQRSLDDVMRNEYRSTYKVGRGFTATDWWAAVSRAAGGKSFTEFNARYVDGRTPFPWDSILPLAGLRISVDTIREARLGLSTDADSAGIKVTQVASGSASEVAGVKVGDFLISLGSFTLTGNDFGPEYRKRFADQDGTDLPIVVRRDGQTLTLPGKVRLVPRVEQHLIADPNASAKAARVRHGILAGVVGE